MRICICLFFDSLWQLSHEYFFFPKAKEEEKREKNGMELPESSIASRRQSICDVMYVYCQTYSYIFAFVRTRAKQRTFVNMRHAKYRPVAHQAPQGRQQE